MGDLLIGTCAFTAAGWPGTFYPAGIKPPERLAFYATKFRTVEIDSTYYGTPISSTVRGWEAKTPAGFVVAAKVPSVITHDKVLRDCDAEFTEFVSTMELLGDKLGPLLLQFPFFNSNVFKSGDDFLARLIPFLEKLPKDHKFALEIRNKGWLDARFADLLRRHNVALALQDQSWMPLPDQIPFDYLTANFSYVRLLGDRKGIEMQTKVWDKTIIDRSKELVSWVDVCQRTVRRGMTTYVYANNHYAGHAPATVAKFLELWEKQKANK